MIHNLTRNVVRKRKLLLGAALLIVSCLLFINSDLSPDLYFLTLEPFENVSCHFSGVGDALPVLDETVVLPARSIFFHETACHGTVNSRQACAVESAARTHPEWQINVLFSGPVRDKQLNSGVLKVLKKFENVKVFRVYLMEYAKRSPLEEMILGGALNRTRWRISHTSDILRYLTLYKYGGIYLDLDMIVVKNMEDLARNWAARESGYIVSSGALSFSRDELGRAVANATLSDLKINYRGDIWPQNGPGVISRVLKGMCETNIKYENMSAEKCNGFEVYGPKYFYPVSWYDRHLYFSAEEPVLAEEPYTHHVWNKMTQYLQLDKDYYYSKLAQKYCPTVYDLFGKNFGL